MRLLTALLLATAALAGCTDPGSTDLDPQDAEPTDPGAEAGEQDRTEPDPPAPAPNRPPTATLTADDADGNAPLNVTFTLDGSDEDGDNLTWTFDRDDDGTIDDQGDSLPATLTHAYEAGDWTARLTVFDGEDEAEATLAVEAFEAGAPPAGPVQEESLSWETGAFGCGAEYDTFVSGAPADGVLYDEFAIDASTHGLPYVMTMGTLGDDSLGGDISFYDGDGGWIAGNLIVGTGELTFEGTVPADAVFAVVSSCGATGASASYAAG